MKILIGILVTILCIQSIASAATNSAVAGPFKISFDLNITKNAVVQPQDTKTDEKDGTVHYTIKIIDPNSPAESGIGINKYSSPTSESIEYNAEMLGKMFRYIFNNVTVEYRLIDGKQGYDVTGTDKEHERVNHSAGYLLDDKTYVAMNGDLPDFDILLNTIHIERMN